MNTCCNRKLTSNIEAIIKNTNQNAAEEIRQDVSRILGNSRPPPSNISKEEAKALKKIKKNKSIIILKADKGNVTVIMDRIDYDYKMEEHLNKSGCYKVLNKDSSSKILRQVSNKIKKSSLDSTIKNRLIPNNAIIPRIYGVPKIHKTGVPLRPIINTTGSPTYWLAKYLANKLRPLYGNTPSYRCHQNPSHQSFQNL